MMRRMLMVGLLIVVGLGLVASVPGADPKADAAKRALDMTNVALGLQMADLGRKAGSPEALIAAAKLLNSVSDVRVQDDFKPAVGTAKEPAKPGDPVDESKAKPADFSRDIEDLLKEARALAKDDKTLLSLIDSVKVNKGKGSQGGPWTSRMKVLQPGDSNTFNFNFIGGEEAYLYVDSDTMVSLEVYRPNGTLVKSASGRKCELSWVPDVDKQFTIYVTNVGKKQATYTIYKN
jgi:hypothetical protein